MYYSDLVKKAAQISFEAHLNDVDKAGYPFFMHPFAVAFNMEDENSTCVALLHDVIEDHSDKYNFEYLRKEGFNNEIIEALRLLTHDESVPYLEYIRKIKNNELARKVKIADLKHNTDIRRNNGVKSYKYDLYIEALKILSE